MSRPRQHGSIALMAALSVLVVVVCLSVIDVGNLFWQKRELQKTADLAALAGAEAIATGCAAGQAAAQASASLNAAVPPALALQCGVWDAQQPATPATTPPSFFQPGGYPPNAIQVHATRTVPYFFVFGTGAAGRTIAAAATAARARPLALLTIGSTLASIDSGQSALLNTVLGGLLGSSLNIGVAGWQGLASTQIDLFQYLDRLALDLGLQAGQYDQVLAAQASAGTLLQAAIEVLGQGAPAQAALDAIAGLTAVKLAAPLAANLQLQNLLQVQTDPVNQAYPGNPRLGLALQVFQLLQGIVMLANGQSAVAASVPLVSLPGIGNVAVQLKVIEGPQIAVGDLAQAQADQPPFDGSHSITVRTAQVRSLVSVNLPDLSLVTGLLNAVTGLLTPITSLLNNVLSLNLLGVLQCTVACTQSQVVLAPGPLRLDVNLDVAASTAQVAGYTCPPADAKSLSVNASTSAAALRIGVMSAADEAAIFSSSATPAVTPLPLVDVQTRTCGLLGLGCGAWSTYSRTGLMANTTVAASPASVVFNDPPDLEDTSTPTPYTTIASTNIIASLATTLSGLQLQTYRYDTSKPNALGDTIGSATALASAAIASVLTLVNTLLSPLLDPLVNLLLTTLGLSLDTTQTGARMSCTGAAFLVY